MAQSESENKLSPEEQYRVERHAKVLKALYARIKGVHKRELHAGQVQIAKAFFVEGKKVIYAQCGRSLGKTESILYIATTYALLNDNVEVYIVCPELKQAKKIYWAPKRLQTFAPPEFVTDINISDLKVTFDNNSHICLDGCENYDALRGIKPHLVIYDEFQDHSKEFDEEVMQPTLMGRNVSLVVCCTPPKKRSAYAVEFRQRLLDEIEAGDLTRAYFEFPSWLNPSLDKGELEKKKAALFKAGDETIWYREYEGRLVFGGEGTVFPHWNKAKHVYPHSVLMAALERDKSKLRWFTACDPGTSTCFAVLFGCYNPYTTELYLLDEIYEKDRKLTNAGAIFLRIKEIENKLYPGHPKGTFRRVYDEAAAWFANEVAVNFREGMIPTCKAFRDIEQDISVLKSVMVEPGMFKVSDKLKWFQWELDSFVTDDNGNYPKEHDHLIDCLAGDTLVDTLAGQIRIGNLVGKKGLLYSRGGLVEPFYDVRKTHEDVDVVRVEFEDDRVITCTPNHLFLCADGTWQKASCLRNGVLIQCATHESSNSQQEAAGVFGQSIYSPSWRELLFPWAKQSLASLGVGALQRAYSQGNASPSLGWRFEQQSNRESLFANLKAAYKRALFSSQKREAAQMDARSGSALGQSLALHERGQGLALRTWQTGLGQHKTYNKALSILWQGVSNKIPFNKFLLPSKLQNEGQKKAVAVRCVTNAGRQNTYCLAVPETHALSTFGGIVVHNCTRYAIRLLNVKFVERVDGEVMSLEDTNSEFLTAGPIKQIALRTGTDWADNIVDSSLQIGDREWN